MNSTTELVDLKTLMALREAAPQVMLVPWDTARLVIKGLIELSAQGAQHEDPTGKKYWQATLKQVHAAGKVSAEASMGSVGKVCRNSGLTLWREGDGYHVAWSKEQLEILKKYFKA